MALTMWALLLPLPWFLLGLLAASVRRRGRPGRFVLVGVFGWPQAQLLQAMGLDTAAAWGLSLAIMIACPLLGYLLGMRLVDRRPENDGGGDPGAPDAQ